KAFHQLPVWNRVKVAAQISIDYLSVPGVDQLVYPFHGILGASLRPISILFRLQVGFEDRPDYQHHRRLDHSVPYRRDAQWALSSVGLLDPDSSYRIRSIALFAQLLRQFPQPPFSAILFDLFKALASDSRRSAVRFALAVGEFQYVFSVDFVVQQVETVLRFFLRFRVERPLQLPNLFRSFQTHVNLLILAPSNVHLELRLLPSTGITRLLRYYEPVRHPYRSGLSLAGFRSRVPPLINRGFPCCVRFPLPHMPSPTTPADSLSASLFLAQRPSACP